MTTTDPLTIRAGELRQQLAESPADARACLELAAVTAQLGDYASALDHDARAWALAPEDPTAIVHILGILVDSGKWLGAMAAFEIARETARPHTAFALDVAATQVLRRIVGLFPPRGAQPEADRLIERLAAGCRVRPVAVQLAVARTLLDLGRLADATPILERLRDEAVEAEDHGQLCFLRAVVYERAGDGAAASSLYEQALVLDARRLDAAVNLLAILLESPEPEATARVAALLERLHPEARELPLVRYHEALYRRRIGDPDGATALLSALASDRTTELGRMARQVLASC